MKNLDQTSPASNPEFQPSGPDLILEDAFNRKVQQFLKATTTESIEEIVDRVVAIWRVIFDKPIKKQTSRINVLKDKVQQAIDTIATLQRELTDGTTPMIKSGEVSFSAPSNFWGLFAFYFLIAVASVATIAEWISFGCALRFITDSIPIGLAYALPIFAIPFGESAYLLILRPKDSHRKLIATLQGSVAVITTAVYVSLSLLRSDSPILSIVSETPSALSGDAWRMAFQMLASLSIAALCVHAAFSLGKMESKTNKAFVKKQRTIEALKTGIARNKLLLGDHESNLAWVEAVRDHAILFCKQKHVQMKANRSNYQQLNNQILDEKL